MSNEISKLVNYIDSARLLQKDVRSIGAPSLASNGTSDPLFASNLTLIRIKDVEELVKPKIEANIFALIDAIGAKNNKSAIEYLNKLIDAGENEIYILTIIVYQFRNLLIVKDYFENSNDKVQMSNQNLKFKISKQTRLNPYVVQKTMIQAKNYTMDNLKKIYRRLLDYDFKIKTGQIEPKITIYLITSELCENSYF